MQHIGLSLSGGSLKGAAHIGVLKEIERRKIKVTHLAGTSAGALVAGLYACGISAYEMENIMMELPIRRFLDFRVGKRGLLRGDRIYNTLLKLTDGRHFKDLTIPFAAVCVDLVSGQLKVIRSGEVAKAIRASIAIPGIFTPVETNNEILVDGYILNNNPADIVKQMGANYVVAVQVKHLKPDYSQNNALSHLRRYINIASQHVTEQKLKEYADLCIDINIRDLSTLKHANPQTLIQVVQIGQNKARRVMNNAFGVFESGGNKQVV